MENSGNVTESPGEMAVTVSSEVYAKMAGNCVVTNKTIFDCFCWSQTACTAKITAC